MKKSVATKKSKTTTKQVQVQGLKAQSFARTLRRVRRKMMSRQQRDMFIKKGSSTEQCKEVNGVVILDDAGPSTQTSITSICSPGKKAENEVLPTPKHVVVRRSPRKHGEIFENVDRGTRTNQVSVSSPTKKVQIEAESLSSVIKRSPRKHGGIFKNVAPSTQTSHISVSSPAKKVQTEAESLRESVIRRSPRKHGGTTKNASSSKDENLREGKNKRKREALDELENQSQEEPPAIGSDPASVKRFVDSDYEVEDDSDLEDLLKDRETMWNTITNKMGDEKGYNNKSEKKELSDSDLEWVDPGDEEDSEEFLSHSSSGSDEEQWGNMPKEHFRMYVDPKQTEDVKFELGMYFKNKEEFQVGCNHHGTINCRKIRFRRNNKKRCTAYCNGSKHCKWIASINYREQSERWQLTRLHLVHKCTPTFNHGCANYRYLCKRYKDDIKILPNIRIGEMVEKIHKDLNINISRTKASNAKKLATSLIQGEWKEQYSKLKDYCHELRRANPGSSIQLVTDTNAAGRELFHRIYVCFEACKKGFVEGCRPLLGLDGCHLRGPHKGILLSAIGLDANDQIFPVAYAVVDIENTSSWTWFLRELQLDLQIKNSSGWTLLSDKQKGLDSAMRSLLPHAEHRLCTWHMYKNFKTCYSSLELKDLLWAAARETHPNQFVERMQEIKDKSEGAFAWLEARTNPKNWSRAFFNTESKCDILVNNICECFNKVILQAREKPLLTMLEALRFYFMDRLQKKRVFIRRIKGQFGPKIKKKLKKNMKLSSDCFATHAGELLYEVRCFNNMDQYVVDIKARTCSYRRWDLTGIPCPHAIAAISKTNEEAESFLDPCYSKEAYGRAYNYVLHPINGPELWERTNSSPLLPPRDIRLPGRPAKARKKDAEESKDAKKKKKRGDVEKLSRVGKMAPYKCRLCHQIGHNAVKCPTKKENGSGCSSMPPTIELHATQGSNIGGPAEQLMSSNASKNHQFKLKGKGVQKCSLCREHGHNRSSCTSSVAALFKGPHMGYSELTDDQRRYPRPGNFSSNLN